MKQEFEFDPTAVIDTFCAALQNDRVCLAMHIVDISEDIREREFWCKHYRTKLDSKQTSIRRRPVNMCKRCEQCRLEHQNGVQPDFDQQTLDKFRNEW